MVIEENIRSSFDWVIGTKIEMFHSGNETSRQTRTAAAEIKQSRPTCIVFVNYVAGSYGSLLSELNCLYPKFEKKPTLLFYIYGNFTLEPGTWARIGVTIADWPAYFVCASRRQSNLVRSFLPPASEKNVVTRPFPVKTVHFRYDPALRRQIRLERRWKGQFIFLYVGRLASQKNVLPLVKHWLKATEHLSEPVKLVLAGAFDDSRSLLFRKRSARVGRYRLELNKYLSSLPENKRAQIEYAGSFSPEELRGVYNAADCYVSLSTYHDEDFGMAPAEALATGLPAILSDWGGYSDFGASPGQCFLMPVAIRSAGIVMKDRIFHEHVMKVVRERGRHRELRDRNARAFARQYSPRKVGQSLNALLCARPPVFRGFSSKLHFFAQLVDVRAGAGVYESSSTADSLYFLNYSHYTGQNFSL
ncbi:MAG: glycosyltransferase family 4 protein [Deltaproteobacteria bacterium]|nr:glycosyltransferase family 4 protein [Deltaproteobacteria bacterium]